MSSDYDRMLNDWLREEYDIQSMIKEKNRRDEKQLESIRKRYEEDKDRDNDREIYLSDRQRKELEFEEKNDEQDRLEEETNSKSKAMET